jgi:Predicted CoA-binding protein
MSAAGQVKGSLSGLFNARSIAVVGASPKKDKPGNQIIRYAQAMDFDGQIYPINPTTKNNRRAYVLSGHHGYSRPAGLNCAGCRRG